MKKGKVKSIGIVLVISFMLVGTISIAQRGRNDGFKHGDHREKTAYDHRSGHKSLNDQLELTDEQKTKIEELKLESSKAKTQRQNQLREKEAQLTTLRTEDKIDQNKINNLIDEIGKLRTEGRKDQVNTDLKIRAMLSEKQRIIFDQHVSARGGRGDYNRHYDKNR